MSQLIPFESAKLPAYLTRGLNVDNDLASGGVGFPVLSIKGKVFHLKRGDEKTLVTKPGVEDEPAASIEVVILKAGPAGNRAAKTYYAKGYVEGADDKPTCYSDDGIAPSADSAAPQAKSCAACPHNVWGARITEDGKKARACADAKRLAVATLDHIEDPMLLRVPAASLKALSQYGALLTKRGVPYQAVVTRIGFDYTVAHPALTFKPVGFVDEQAMAAITEATGSDLVQQIVGAVPVLAAGETFDSPPEPRAKVQVEAAAKPEPEPRAKVQVEAAAKPKAKPRAKEATVAADDIDAGLDAALDSLDFDD